MEKKYKPKITDSLKVMACLSAVLEIANKTLDTTDHESRKPKPSPTNRKVNKEGK